MSEGRLAETEAVKRMSVEIAYDFLYKRRVAALNDGLRILQQYEERERSKR